MCPVTGAAGQQGHEHDRGPTAGTGRRGVENPFSALQRTSAHGLPSSRDRRLLSLR